MNYTFAKEVNCCKSIQPHYTNQVKIHCKYLRCVLTRWAPSHVYLSVVARKYTEFPFHQYSDQDGIKKQKIINKNVKGMVHYFFANSSHYIMKIKKTSLIEMGPKSLEQ